MKPGKVISKRLRDLREAAGLSQQDVAMRADLSLSLVAKLEQGKKADPRASTLIALAAALGIKPGTILDDLVPPDAGPAAEEAHAEPATEEADERQALEEAMAMPSNGKAKKKKKAKKPGKTKKK